MEPWTIATILPYTILSPSGVYGYKRASIKLYLFYAHISSGLVSQVAYSKDFNIYPLHVVGSDACSKLSEYILTTFD